ncbi:hypothetical protein OROMI_008060 [Orobanche minor]
MTFCIYLKENNIVVISGERLWKNKSESTGSFCAFKAICFAYSEVEGRSTGFVDSLLSVDKSGHTVEADVMDSTHQENTQMPHIVEYTDGTDPHAQKHVQNAEIVYLKKEQERKKEMRKYKVGVSLGKSLRNSGYQWKFVRKTEYEKLWLLLA